MTEAASTNEAAGSSVPFTVTGTDQKAAWAARRLPPVERIAGDMWSVPVPIPANPLRYTLSYLVPGDRGLVVVDPGWDSGEGWLALLAGLTEAGASPADVTGIVVTHVHPDHHGLTGRLKQHSGAWVAMHPAERDTLTERARENGADGADGAPSEPVDRRAAAREWLRGAGAPESDVLELVGPPTGTDTRRGRRPVAPDVLLEDGDAVPLPGRTLNAVWTPGHTPGHLCLREPLARVLLTGDHVLPRITPNIGLHARAPKLAPLAQFLDSLGHMAAYDDHEALPAHEYRFRGLARRAEQLRAHHGARLSELADVVAESGSATLWQVAERLTWSRPWDQVGAMRFAALAETDAHLRHLVESGDLTWQDAGSGPRRVRPARSASA